MNKSPLIPEGPVARQIARRHRKEKRFRGLGLVMILCACAFLGILLITIVGKGYSAFVRTQLQLAVQLDAEVIDPAGTRDLETLSRANYQKLVHDALRALFPEVTDRRGRIQLYQLVSKGAGFELRDYVLADPTRIGQTHVLWLPASSEIDMLKKGYIDRALPEVNRVVKDRQLGWFDALAEQERVRSSFNTVFFTGGDSREPEQAGILGSMLGSFFTIIICMLVSFPVGVTTAVYLEEFAPKNRLTDVLEVNINNLAAVPSIVFGLLGLSIYLNLFGMPRSSALVGGLTLALLILPVIIIATRHALKAVPPSIRDAARALGASPMQVVLHHTLPLSLPGIMTGTILSVARALGETAPLLMIGMVAFVADVPQHFLSPSTTMPVQIYLWSDSPELGFIEKTSAAIIVLLVFLVLANALAVWLRKRYAVKW